MPIPHLVRPKIDPFILLLLGTVALASLLPARAAAAAWAGMTTQAAIALPFFLHGAMLSREAILAGVGAWRVHGVVFAANFVLFPLLWVLWHRVGVGDLLLILIARRGGAGAGSPNHHLRCPPRLYARLRDRHRLLWTEEEPRLRRTDDGGGPVILPLMPFRQIQLMVCAMLAARYSKMDMAALPGSAPPFMEERRAAC